MATLVILITSGKGLWKHAFNLINSFDWEKVFVITNDFGYDKLTFHDSNVEKIKIDFNQDYAAIISQIKNKLNFENLFEIGLNISSGNGTEHMALITALMEIGVSLKFVDVVNGKFQIIETKMPWADEFES